MRKEWHPSKCNLPGPIILSHYRFVFALSAATVIGLLRLGLQEKKHTLGENERSFSEQPTCLLFRRKYTVPDLRF